MTSGSGDRSSNHILSLAGMLGLQAWRAPLHAAARTILTPSKPPTAPQGMAQLDAFIDTLKAALPKTVPGDPTAPPAAGINGYPPPNPPRPSNKKKAVLHDYLITERPRYRLHVFSNRNNTIATFTKPDGGAVAWFSAGSCGFKNAQRSTYEAGYQCAVRIFKKIEEVSEKGPIEIDMFFKGFGLGREALYRALLTTEGQRVRPMVVSITDRTPIKIGGTRSKKARRL